MKLAYLDESQSHDALCITALVVPGDSAKDLADALDGVVEAAAGLHAGVRSSAELHGYALVAGRDDWEPLKSCLEARIQIYRNAISAIAASDSRIYIRGAELKYHATRYGALKDPYETVLPWVLERVQGDVASDDEHALVIADEVAQQDRHRSAFRQYQRFATSGWRSQTLNRLIDTIHFAPSKQSRLLQAADLIAYNFTQLRKDGNPRATAVWEDFWQALRPNLAEATIWSGPW